MTLGGIIKSLRARAELTQVQLAERAGVSESLIVAVEGDKRLLGPDNLMAVADAVMASDKERNDLVAARLRQKGASEPTNAELGQKLDHLIGMVEKLGGKPERRRGVGAGTDRTPSSMPRPALRGRGSE